MLHLAIKWAVVVSALSVMFHFVFPMEPNVVSLFCTIVWVASGVMALLTVLHCNKYLKQILFYVLTVLFLFSGVLKLFDWLILFSSQYSGGERLLHFVSRLLDSTFILISLTFLNRKLKLGLVCFLGLLPLVPFFLLLYFGAGSLPTENMLFSVISDFFVICSLAVSIVLLRVYSSYLPVVMSKNLQYSVVLILLSEIMIAMEYQMGALLLRTGAAWYVYKSIAGSVFEVFRKFAAEEIVCKRQSECMARKKAEDRLWEQEVLRGNLADMLAEDSSEKLLDKILSRAVTLLNGTGGELGIIDKNTNLIRIESSLNIETRKGSTFALGEGLIGSVALNRKPLLIHSNGVGEGRLPFYPFVRWSGIVAVPLECAGELTGVIVITETNSLHEFTQRDLDLLTMFADQAAIVLKNVQNLETVRFKAETDSLTGLYNRGHFMTLAKGEIERALRYNHSLSAIMFDIDHFKMINDTYGHCAGDRVIETISELCRKMFRKIDIVGRYGGEEFIALLPETDPGMAVEVAERYRQAVGTSVVLSGENQIGVTVSLGIASTDNNCKRIAELIERADEALYVAKFKGRDRICCWNAELHSELEKSRSSAACK